MKRTLLFLSTTMLALLLASGVAWAVNMVGTNGPDTLRGTNGDDNLAFALSMVPTAAAFAAGPVHCGDVLTQDTVLKHDLTNCGGDGLIIGADGVKVNLNGHKIDGTDAAGSAGIRNSGHDNVKINGGGVQGSGIREFKTGIRLRGAHHNRVRGLGVDGSSFGIALFNSHANLVRGSGVLGGEFPGPSRCETVRGAAIALFNSHRNHIQRNSAELSDFGIALVRSHRNRLGANQAAPSNSDGNACFGIYLAHSNRNVVRKNVAENNVIDGIFVRAGSRNTLIVGNRAQFNSCTDCISRGDGIDVNSPATTITRNTANKNGDLGIEAVPGVTDGGGNTASNNGDPRQCMNVHC
jgi:parallel beta-helix repeat protein